MSHLKLRFAKIIFSSFFSLGIIYLSYSDSAWTSFWGFLNIPASEPFSDFKALNIFLEYKKNGFNPYFKNPMSDPVHMFMIYPSIWLNIFDYLNLKNDLNFQITVFLILFTYFFVLVDLFLRIKNTYFKYLFLIFFFSTSNFLLIERLNVEIILFCLIYFALVNQGFFKQFIFYLLGVMLKIFPIFSIFMFIEKKKSFFIVLLFSIIYLFIVRDEINFIKNNVIEYALIFAYGTLSISKAIYFYSTEFDLFINDGNYSIFKNTMIFGMGLISTIIVLSRLRINREKILGKITINERMFLAGGGIYIGTFIFSANIDYRLIFLLLTVPYILDTTKKNYLLLYTICLVVCFNSLIIEGGNPYSFFYFFKASIIYFLKFIILAVNCYYFGAILDKFIYFDLSKVKKR